MRIALFALVLGFLGPSVAHACSCVGSNPKTDAEYQALVDEADVLFEGRAGESRWEGDIDMDTFHVLRSFKGPHRETVALDSGMRRIVDGDSGGITLTMGSCGSLFEQGETYLVFASEGGQGLLYSGVCSQTRLSRKARRWLKFLEKEPSESGPPAIEPASGCRASPNAPTPLVAFGLIMVLGIRTRRSSRR